MSNSPYIALADDDPEDREILTERFLKAHPGIQFKLFNNGREITEYLQSCPDPELPIMVILDYKMPLQTGPDVLQILQNDIRYRSVRKVVWSTSGNKQYISECFQYGAEKYFTKPNDTPQLDKIIAQISELFFTADHQ